MAERTAADIRADLAAARGRVTMLRAELAEVVATRRMVNSWRRAAIIADLLDGKPIRAIARDRQVPQGTVATLSGTLPGRSVPRGRPSRLEASLSDAQRVAYRRLVLTMTPLAARQAAVALHPNDAQGRA